MIKYNSLKFSRSKAYHKAFTVARIAGDSELIAKEKARAAYRDALNAFKAGVY